ncbi:MAG: response regulator [Rhodospirillales bacterium]|nr:response regulator [Rhodospirillales bacterium]
MAAGRLLICDDEERFGRFVQRVAMDLDFEVQVTSSADEFIAVYDDFEPTVIILDMIMPDMDGNELILWLAQRRSPADLIICTGYNPDYATNAKILAEFKGLKSVTTLRKPVSVALLRQALQATPQAAQRT